MSNVSGIRPQDILKGAKAYIRIAPWASGAEKITSGRIDLGLVDDVEFTASNDVKKVTASNCTLPVDAYVTGREFGLKFTLKEAALRRLAVAMNDDPTASTGDVVVGTSPHTAVLALDEQQATRYWQVQCVIADQVMVPGYTEDASATYAYREIILWRCVLEAKVSARLTKDGEWAVPVTVHAVYDGTYTYAKGEEGAVGIIVDSTNAPS